MLEKSVHICWLAAGLVNVKMQSVYITIAVSTCPSVSEKRHVKNSFLLSMITWSLSFCSLFFLPHEVFCLSLLFTKTHLQSVHIHPQAYFPFSDCKMRTTKSSSSRTLLTGSLHKQEVVTSSVVSIPKLKISHKTFDCLSAHI